MHKIIDFLFEFIYLYLIDTRTPEFTQKVHDFGLYEVLRENLSLKIIDYCILINLFIEIRLSLLKIVSKFSFLKLIYNLLLLN